MAQAIGGLNWLSVIVATIIYYVLGALWFAPFGLGKSWDRALGFTRPAGWRPTPLYYVGPLIGCFLSTVATAILVEALNLSSFGDAILLGLVAGIGYAAAVSFVNAITPNTPLPLLYGAVVGGYHVVGIVIVSAIVTLWR